MIDNQIFAWGNYEEDPKNIMGIDTLPTQKSATYNSAADGVFTGSIEESFFTNIDKSLVSNPAMVIGEAAMELVEGKGAVVPGVDVHYITNADEYAAAMDETTGWLYKAGYTEGPEWADNMAWAVAIVEKDTHLQVTANGAVNGVEIRDYKTGDPVDNMFPRGEDHSYLIVDKGEVFVDNKAMTDVTKINFIAVA